MTTVDYIVSIWEIDITARIAHLQASSLSEHLSLNELYSAMADFADKYVESFQGIYGILTNYPALKTVEGKDMVNYLKTKVLQYREFKKTVKESELQQQIDNLIEFLNSIIYKLKFLK